MSAYEYDLIIYSVILDDILVKDLNWLIENGCLFQDLDRKYYPLFYFIGVLV